VTDAAVPPGMLISLARHRYCFPLSPSGVNLIALSLLKEGKSAAQPNLRVTRRSGGLGWWIVGSLWTCCWQELACGTPAGWSRAPGSAQNLLRISVACSCASLHFSAGVGVQDACQIPPPHAADLLAITKRRAPRPGSTRKTVPSWHTQNPIREKGERYRRAPAEACPNFAALGFSSASSFR
jgi:hypothetical protein